jgi:uncharacterized repeat protein (TIGR03803 family)
MKIRSRAGWKSLFLFCLVASIVSPAQTFRTLVDLNGANGAAPGGPLIQGLDGNLHGAANSGGSGDTGTVFELTPADVLTTLYDFCTENGCKDGANPVAALVQARDGTFYGITTGGGVNSRGTVFGLTPAGKLRTVYSFCAQADCADGEFPQGLVLAPDGNFYGTTQTGGANGQGTVFSLTFDSGLTTLYSFCAQASCADGEAPNGLILATDGNFYGTTQGGGANGYGTVFKITHTGALKTLYSFCAETNCADGGEPGAALLQANDGNLYGTTDSGGSAGGAGTIFKITLAGALTTLHIFCAQGPCDDGTGPISPLVQATDRAFYGTTGNAGASNYGTIFTITSEGALTTLHSFDGSDGGDVKTGLFQATNGNLYGTAADGGSGSCDTCGTIFSLNVGLGRFAETLPTSGAVGSTIDVLSQGLTGATAVSFNGTAASFTVVSDTYLTATIPSGATTGFVSVTTPGATLKSNLKFRVVP